LTIELPKSSRLIPSFKSEKLLSTRGFRYIAGIDEVGRGSLAGPVVAAAVVLPMKRKLENLNGVRDSKELTPAKREYLNKLIQEVAIDIGVGVISSQIIDAVNILNATRLAMYEAVKKLSHQPDYLLIDGMTLPQILITQQAIIKGDKSCLSIACASIVAKVTRDHMMTELGNAYPDYGFQQHKGYGTRSHLECINRLGPTPVHRYSFSPVRNTAKLI
jgi:ribonuclease HII